MMIIGAALRRRWHDDAFALDGADDEVARLNNQNSI